MPNSIESSPRIQSRLASRWRQAVGLLRRLAVVSLWLAVCASPSMVRAQSQDVAAETLVLVNLIRQRLAGCREDGGIVGRDLWQTVSLGGQRGRPPLTWNPRLADIARQQAQAMANQQFFSHVDTAGHSIGKRADLFGYRWHLIGENLASGQRDIVSAMRGWLQSFTHCRNLIDDRFTEVGVARVESTDPDDVYGTYWVMVLGRPAPHQQRPAQPVLLAQVQQAATAALFAALN
ncbi:MAG: CAP domain-containing protein [Burkholderiaceae bacterium]